MPMNVKFLTEFKWLMKSEDKPGALEDKAFFICTAEILPIAAIGQPDKLSSDKLLLYTNDDQKDAV